MTARTVSRGSRVFLINAFVILAALAPGWAGEQAVRYEKFADLNGKRIGVLNGTFFDYVVNDTLDLTQMFYYETTDELFEALERGEIDCVVDDEPIMRFFISRHPGRGFRVLELLEPSGYAFPMRKDSAALRAAIDKELRAMLDDGTVEDIVTRWMEGTTVRPPERPVVGGRVVRAGIFSEAEPFAFVDASGQVVGIEVEILTTIARRLGYDLRVQPMTFDALFDALLAGEVDIITGCIAVTDERKQIVDFTLPYYEGGVAAMVHEKK